MLGVIDVLCEKMMKSVAIFRCVIVGLGVVSVCVLLLVPLLKLLFGSLFLYDMDLFSFGFNGSHWQWWFNISFKKSGNFFSTVGINLPHSKYKGSICLMYLLLMYNFVPYWVQLLFMHHMYFNWISKINITYTAP